MPTVMRLRRFVLGLFIVAQVAGLAPLLLAHVHAPDRAIVVSGTPNDRAPMQQPVGCDECCVVSHHLIGVVNVAPVVIAQIVLVRSPAAQPAALPPGEGTAVPERPPKSVSLV